MCVCIKHLHSMYVCVCVPHIHMYKYTNLFFCFQYFAVNTFQQFNVRNNLLLRCDFPFFYFICYAFNSLYYIANYYRCQHQDYQVLVPNLNWNWRSVDVMARHHVCYRTNVAGMSCIPCRPTVFHRNWNRLLQHWS